MGPVFLLCQYFILKIVFLIIRQINGKRPPGIQFPVNSCNFNEIHTFLWEKLV